MRHTLLLSLIACDGATSIATSTTDTDLGVATPPPPTDFCQLLADGMGDLCRTSIRNRDVLEELGSGGRAWWLVVNDEEAAVPPLIIDSNRFSDPAAFLAAALPDAYGELGLTELQEDAGGRDADFMFGQVRLDPVLAFDVYGGDAPLRYQTVKDARDVLADIINEDARTVGDLVFAATDAQRDRAGGWRAKFPIEGIVVIEDYEPYAMFEAVGTVRLVTKDAFETGERGGQWGLRDLLVVDEAIGDSDAVVAGAVVGERMSAISALASRSRARGTPHCFVSDPHTVFASYADQLVRFGCDADGFTIESAAPAEGVEFRESLLPSPLVPVVPDYSAVELVGLDAPLELASHGSRTVRLAEASAVIPAANRPRAIAVPISFHRDFLERNQWIVDLGTGPASYSFADTIDAWAADPTLLDDPATRRSLLTGLHNSMRGGVVDPLLIQGLGDAIPARFGSPIASLRFRASPTVDGAWRLPYPGDPYQSVSGCVADDLDADPIGPSRCDSAEPIEQPAQRAIAEVYASLWSPAAYAQREFWGIADQPVSMGFVVTDRSVGEQADVLVIDGGGDDVHVHAQGDGRNVIEDADELPEYARRFVTGSDEGRIVRLQGSTRVSRGEAVLTDTQLEAVTEVALAVTQTLLDAYPVPGDSEPLVLTDWEFLANGQLVLKRAEPVAR